MTSNRLILLGVLAAGLLAGCQKTPQANPLEAARSALERNDPRAAVIALKMALQQNPGAAEERFLLGTSLFDIGDSQGALVEFTKVESTGFDAARLAPAMARTMLSLGEFKAVVDKYAKTELDAPPAQADLLATLALAQSNLGHGSASQQAMQKALSLAPTGSWVLRTQANFVAGAGRLDEALAILEKSLQAGRANGDAWLVRAEILLRGKKDTAGAIDAYKKAIDDPRTRLSARLGLGELYLGSGEFAQAEAQLKELKKIAPNSLRAAYFEALLAYQQGDYARAREQAGRLAARLPDDARHQFLVGAANLKLHDLLQAESALGRAVNLAPQWRLPRWHLAQTYIDMGQFDKARGVLAPVIEGPNPDPKSLVMMATIQLKEGDLARADALFARAAALKPSDLSVRTSLALADLAKGRADQAFDALQAIAASDAGTSADMVLINAHLQRREYDAALQAIERLRAKQPQGAAADHLRGVVLQAKADVSGARKAFEAALARDPGYFASAASLARLDMAQGKAAEARDRMQAVIKAQPQNNAARMLLVSILAMEGAKPDAVKAVLNEAIRSNPLDPAPRLALMALHRDLREIDAGLSTAQEAMSAIPDNPAILEAGGQAQVLAGQDQQAASTFGKMAAVAPGSPVPQLRLADLYARRGEKAATVTSLRRAAEVAPDSPEVLSRVVAYSRRTRDQAFGRKLAAELQTRLPQNAAGFLLEGDMLTLAKDYKAAEAAYRKALGKVDPAGRAAISVYLSLAAAAQESEAKRFVDAWLNEHPKDVGTRLRLGEVRASKGDGASAEALFTQALAIDPQNVQALVSLAALRLGRAERTALDPARRAAALAPLDPVALGVLAGSLQLNGSTDEALQIGRRALALSGGRPEVRLEYAKLLVKAGKADEARKELEVLAALGSSFARGAEVAGLRKGL